jgi:hypothetical protein
MPGCGQGKTPTTFYILGPPRSVPRAPSQPFCYMNKLCKTTLVTPERYKVVNPVASSDHI